jgi:hypothetical protein
MAGASPGFGVGVGAGVGRGAGIGVGAGVGVDAGVGGVHGVRRSAERGLVGTWARALPVGWKVKPVKPTVTVSTRTIHLDAKGVTREGRRDDCMLENPWVVRAWDL